MPEFLKEFLRAYMQVSGYNLITKQDGSIITENIYVKMWKSIQSKIDIFLVSEHQRTSQRTLLGTTTVQDYAIKYL